MKFSCSECQSSEKFFVIIPSDEEDKKGCYISCVDCGYIEDLARFLIIFGLEADIDAIRHAVSEE